MWLLSYSIAEVLPRREEGIKDLLNKTMPSFKTELREMCDLFLYCTIVFVPIQIRIEQYMKKISVLCI